jgi:hypothetical protein
MDEKIGQVLSALLLSTRVFERGLGMKKFAILGMLAALLSSTANATEETSCKVTKEQADSIKKDMPHEKVVAIVGCEGILTMWGPDSATPWLARYNWSGNGGERSFLIVEFFKGNVMRVSKARLQ